MRWNRYATGVKHLSLDRGPVDDNDVNHHDVDNHASHDDTAQRRCA